MQLRTNQDSRRGSAILITVIVTVCLSLIIFSVIKIGLFERKMNASELLRAQARYAAESVVENATAQAVRAIMNNSWLSNDHFNTSENPSTITALPSSVFAGTAVDYSTVELKAPDMTSYQMVSIPSASPDALRGQSILIRRLTFYGKATAKDGAGRSETAYCSQTLQIRGQSPATNMAFYNMELELAPGPIMYVTGPIFSNRDIYFAASNLLEVRGSVATPGNLRWGRIVEDSLSAWNATSANQKGRVKLTSGYTEPSDPSADGTYSTADFYYSNSYADSLVSSSDSDWTSAEWKDAENQKFNGWVQTSVDDVAERKFQGITDLANAHAVIEASVADTATGYDKNVELQKFSNKAGIILRPPKISGGKTSTTTTAVTKKTNTSTGVTTTTYGTPSSSSSDSYTQTAGATVWAYVPDGSQSGTYEGPFTREKEDGSLGTYYLMEITDKVPNLSNILTTTTGSSTSGTDAGFYDGREGEWMTLYNIDVKELASAVADTDADNYLHKYWNGIFYVDCSADTAPTTTTTTTIENVTTSTQTVNEGTKWKPKYVTYDIEKSDSVVATAQTNPTGILLQNGGLGDLPEIPGVDSSKSGFTLATDSVVYIKGNYNADGSVSTSDPAAIRAPDSTTDESMACIAADAVTMLSNSWDNAESSLSKGDRKATTTEVSAVIMTGLVRTEENSSYSGGMHNFPRFLESWSNVPFGYRGSLLAFFESQRGNGKWTLSYYDPPNRIWGWDKRLEKDRTVYGLSRLMTFRRVGFLDLSPAQYTTATNGL